MTFVKALLDPSDSKLDFVLKKETVRPISIFRMKDGSFFLCYTGKVLNFNDIWLIDFGFYINKMGQRAREDLIVYWAGNPTYFTFLYPFIIAYEPSFIEIRHLETGHLQQVIHTSNQRVLSFDQSFGLCVSDSFTSDQHQHIFCLTNNKGD